MQDKLCQKTDKKGRDELEINEIEKKLIEMVIAKTLLITGDQVDINKLEFAMSEVLNSVREKATSQIIEMQDPKVCSCECGKKMIVINRPERTLIGLASYKIKRRTFYCEPCKKYSRPLDKQIGKGRYSLEVKQAMILLGQRMPFQEASDYLEKLLKLSVSEQTIETYVKHVGRAIAESEKKTVLNMVGSDGYIKNWDQDQEPVSLTPETQPKKKPGAAYLQLDGAMVHTREEGWKEVRNGLLFRAKDVAQTDKNHREILVKQYFTVFNNQDTSLQQFKDRATQAAYDFGFHHHEYPVIVSDGARWIWDYASQCHPDAIQILDYFHASEYLGKAFSSLKLEDKTQLQQTKDRWFEWLWNGQINTIISALLSQNQTQEVLDCIRYFKNNQGRMRYKYYRDLGLQIGSGAIESAHRIIIHCRMKQSGMHWNKDNVQSIASLRASYLSGHWNHIVDNFLLAA